jgi:hypothetical protein
MFAYGIGILPLIGQLKAKFPQVEQPWYADDAGAGAKFDEIECLFPATVRDWPAIWLLSRAHQEHSHCAAAQSQGSLASIPCLQGQDRESLLGRPHRRG